MRTLFLLIGVLLVSVAASAEAVSADSVDVGVTNDFPLGDYQSKSSYNLGLAARLNTKVTGVPYVHPFVEADNNYWLATPSWVSFGTQINALIGVDGLYTLPTSEWGVFTVGGGLGYGLMTHLVEADTKGEGSRSYSFVDQVLLVELQCDWHLDKVPVDVVVTPRFLFSPEQNDQKYQLGVATGIRIALGGEQ